MNASAQAAWVQRFFLPLLRRQGLLSDATPLAGLHLGATDALEVQAMNELGHRCQALPSMATPWPVAAASQDLLWSGRWASLPAGQRQAFAQEAARVLRPGGGVLLCLGNRRCWLDLSEIGPRLHRRSGDSTADCEELQERFIKRAGFAGWQAQSARLHFGPGGNLASRVLRRLLVCALNGVHRLGPAAYAGAMNPLLLVWIRR